MPEETTKEWIWERLRNIRYCILANQSGNGTIDVRAMAFSCSRDLRAFYMLSPKNTKKIDDFEKHPDATLHVYSITQDMEEFIQCVVKGKVTIHREIKSPELKECLQIVAEKLDVGEDFQVGGMPCNWVVLELRAKEFVLTRYQDILHSMPSMKIRL